MRAALSSLRKSKARRYLFGIALYLMATHCQALNIELAEDCTGADPYCNVLALYVLYTPTFVGVGSNFTNCATFRAAWPGRFQRIGVYPDNGCKFLASMAYGNDLYVGVGSNEFGDSITSECVIFVSRNGTDWTNVNCNPTGGSGLQTVTFGNGIFLASSTGSDPAQLRASTDGYNWTAPATGPGGGIDDFLFANGVFYAASKNGVFTSGDPLNVAFVDAGATAAEYRALAAGPDGRIVAVGQSGITPVVETFVDGSWNAVSGLFANGTGGELPRAILHDGSRFVVAGGTDSGTGADCFIDYSYDGLAWTGGATAHSACAQTTDNWQAQSLAQWGTLTILSGLVFVGTDLTASILSTTGVENGQWTHEYLDGTDTVVDFQPAR